MIVFMLKKAVGIGFEKNKDKAPKIIAKGKGEMAERIIAIAKEHGIHVKEDKSLIEILDKFDIAQEIPEELYQVIAEIFLYVYNLEKR